MQLDTKYFGRIDYDPADVITFPSGLFGFSGETAFLLLPFAGSEGNMLCLQSVQTPGLAFIAMNPFSLKPDYAPVLSAEALELMEVQRSEDLCYYVMCVVRDPVGASTLNLRCPVVIVDLGLDREGLAVAQRLALRWPVVDLYRPEDGAEAH